MSGDSPSTSGQQGEGGVGGSPAEAVWKTFGRDNPAGKALYKLYSKDASKAMGNQYNQRNKELHEKKLATGWTPPPAEATKPKPVEKPKVAVPKFYGGPKRIDYQEVGREMGRVRYIPRRKPVDAIRQEIDDEYERMRATPQMPPKGPVLDEREKDRLSALMRFRGKVPEVTPEEVALATKKAASRKKSEKEQLEDLFDAVLKEIEERRAFLRDLEGMGALKAETMHQVRAEIQQRVAELERIDMLMKKCDGLEEEDGQQGGRQGRR